MRKMLLGVALGLAAGAALLLLVSDDAEAQTPRVTYPPTRIGPEGTTVEIWVTVPAATDAAALTRQVNLEVVNPFGCEYLAQYGVPNANNTFSFVYPNGFTADASNAPGCGNPSTMNAGNLGGSQWYEVRARADQPVADGCSFIRRDCFQIRMTSDLRRDFIRSDNVRFISRGFEASSLVQVQIDTPDPTGGQGFVIDYLTTDPTGAATYDFTIPPGGTNPNDRSSDLGEWTIRFVGDGKGNPSTNEDVSVFRVNRTRIALQWTKQPDDLVQRTDQPNARFRMYYETSVPGGARTELTRTDLSELGNGPIFDVLENKTANGTAGTEFVPETGEWEVDWRSGPDRPTGPFRFGVRAKDDIYGNPLLDWRADSLNELSLRSDTFALGSALLRPQFTISSATVLRADEAFSVHALALLRYPNGDTVPPANLSGPLRVALFNGQGEIPGTRMFPAPQGNGWSIGGVGNRLVVPPGTELAPVRLGVVEPTLDLQAPSPNRLDLSVRSPAMMVSAAVPEISSRFLNAAGQERANFLRGDPVRISVELSYADGTLITPEHVPVAGSPGSNGSYAKAVLSRPDGTERTVFLTYSGSTRTWEGTYASQTDDPVGEWLSIISLRDRWGNSNRFETTLNIGLTIQMALSTSSLHRSENLTVTATMYRSGSAAPETGNVRVTIRGAGQVLADHLPMAATPQGAYRYTLHVPSTAALGTYTVDVEAQSATDRGQRTTTFDLVAAGIQVVQPTVEPANAPRLEPVRVSFILRYPDQAPLTPSDVTPRISARPPTGPDQNLAVAFDAVSGRWSSQFDTELSTLPGEYAFIISGRDLYGNPIESFTTRSFIVRPTEITVSHLETARLSYTRGQALSLLAEVRYADGSVATAVIAPVEVLAGTTRVGTVDLVYDPASGRHKGVYAVKSSDPPSTATEPWGLLARQGTAQDAHGNTGPVADVREGQPFTVRQSLLAVQFVELPAQGLRVGSGEVSVKFLLVDSTGAAVSGAANGIRASLHTGTEALANFTPDVDGDGYSLRLSLTQPGFAAGSEYRFRIEGEDGFGNDIEPTESVPFTLAEAQKANGAPGASLIVILAGALLALLGRRLRQE